MAAPRLGRDEATAAQIAEHLRRCERDFVPALGGRVDIDRYAEKIAARATRFEGWDADTLVGLVAVYENDPGAAVAFITSVSVVPEHQRRGLAGALLTRAIESARAGGFDRIALEVGRTNPAAVRLYAGAGFGIAAEQDGIATMTLELQPTDRTESQP